MESLNQIDLVELARARRLAPWGMIDATSLRGIEQPLEGVHFLSHSQRYLDQVPSASFAVR
jgi:hypothetical protein